MVTSTDDAGQVFSAENAESFMRAEIERLRKQLIDISKRNPLIAFKHSERGASFVRVVDERPDHLFQRLREGTMRFEPLPDASAEPADEKTADFQLALEAARLSDVEYRKALEILGESERDGDKVAEAEQALRRRVRAALGLPNLAAAGHLNIVNLARAHGIDPNFDLASRDNDRSPHLSDNKIRVLIVAERLDARLRTIHDRYRSHAAEGGIHTLSVAFGFVEWPEDDTSDVVHHAPLLLMPVYLDREPVRGRYRYTLSGRGEEVIPNMALREMLRQRFAIELPSLEEDDSPERYFAKLQQILEHNKRLRVRRFVTIGIFPFPRMALWADLDPDRWPQSTLLSHREVSVLLGARAAGADSSAPGEYFANDDALTDVSPPLVLPADVSQHAALVAAADGSSLAIEGPPGTGKSQTIANMVAMALDCEKRVLFLAEKRAALDVVAKRLVERGFGTLLLELHSDRATKTEVLASLKKRLHASSAHPKSVLDLKRQQLREQRDSLRRYIALLRMEVGALGKPVNALYWRYLALNTRLSDEMPLTLRRHNVASAETMSALDLLRKRDRLDALEKIATKIEEQCGRINTSAWHAATVLPPHSFGQRDVRDRLDALIGSVDAVVQCLQRLTEKSCLECPQSDVEMDAMLRALKRLPPDDAKVCQIRVRTARAYPEACRSLLARLDRYRALLDQASTIRPCPLEANLAAIEVASEQLKSLRLPTSTLQELQVRLNGVRRELSNLAKLLERTREIFTLMQLDPDQFKGAQLRLILALCRRLHGVPPQLLALRSPHLLEIGAEQELGEHAAVAAELAAREATLSATIDLAAAAAAGPNLLEELARKVGKTNPITRVVSSAYKEARAKGQSIIGQAALSRAALVEQLSAVAQWLRDASAFGENDGPARFVGAGWNGHRTNFAAVENCRNLLRSLADHLLPENLGNVLGFFVHAQTPTLQALLARVELDRDEEQGLSRLDAELTILEAICRARDEEQGLIRAIAAFQDAGFVGDTVISIEEPSTLSLFRQLQALRADLIPPPGAHEDWAWYRGADETPNQLQAALAFAEAIDRAALPDKVRELLDRSSSPGKVVSILTEEAAHCGIALQAYRQAWGEFASAVGTTPDRFLLCDDHTGLTFADIRARLVEASARAEALPLFADLLKALADAEEHQVRFVFDAFANGGQALRNLADIFERCVIQTLLSEFLAADGKDLLRLGGLTLEQARRRYRELDEETMALEAQRILATRLGDKVPEGVSWGPRSTWSELAVMENELNKIKRHIPIRELVKRAAAALQALKPVWLMSPMSVAQYVPPGTADFDLVIIDEASQMRPEFAIGAIARGAKVVVVGDSKQLPPTSFFETQGLDDDDEEESAAATESILDLALARLGNKRSLRWHYRSRHAALISFSNRMFYDRKLIVFPSPDTSNPLLGVKYTYVEGASYEDKINRKEAQEVIQAAVGLMYTYPELTIGIATMNIHQRELINNEMERIAQDDATVGTYIERHAKTIEPFFVKNLENVQGDERDVIVISTLYGPAPGTGRVPQRFGPINSVTGHRRLNVLFTRAKMATMVFSSLKPTDVIVGPETKLGVSAFRGFLEYAADGAVVDEPTGSEPDSDFEVFVADRLRAAGYEVVPQVGVERFRIDLGVRHESYPAGFLAGIECDGATYHAALTIRDRDRIRQEILEGLGWRMYRVWSTDWFNDADRETAKLLRWLEDIRERAAARHQSHRAAVEAVEAKLPRAADDPRSKRKPVRSVATATPRPAESPGNEARARPRQPSEIHRSETEETFLPLLQAAPVAAPAELKPEVAPCAVLTAPEGRKRSIGGIDFYEVQSGFYEVWVDGRQVGEVQRLLRTPVLAARLYGNRVVAPITHYQATVTGTGETFNVDDVYEAVREVAKRAAAETA